LSLAHGFRKARAQLRERRIEIDRLLEEIRKTRDELDEIRNTPCGHPYMKLFQFDHADVTGVVKDESSPELPESK